MPTPYTSVPTATQGSSPKPGAGRLPISQVPTDGDNENGATYSQDAKYAADWLGWLAAPASDSTDPQTVAWFTKNILGQHRAGYDHRGYPTGRFLEINEDFIGLDSVPAAQSLSSRLPRWRYNLTGTGSGVGIACFEPSTSGFLTGGMGNYAGFNPLNAAINQFAEIFTNPAHIKATDDTDVSWDCDMAVSGTDGDVKAGLMDPGHTTALDAVTYGVWFAKIMGTPHWQCVSGDGTTVSMQDSGVSPAAGQHFHFEFTGANTDDTGVRRALFFINGTLIGIKTSNLPFNAGASAGIMGLRFGAINQTVAGSGVALYAACLKYRQAIAPGNLIG